MSETLTEADVEAAFVKARERLGEQQQRARTTSEREAAESRGSAPQTSLASARTTHESVGSILSRWERDLSTTGAAERVQEAERLIGRLPGGGGAGAMQSNVVALRHGGEPQCSTPTRTLSPLTHERLIRLLAELDTLTKTRAESPEERRFRLGTYRERLREFDGEAVEIALRNWPNAHDWWPTWAELRREIKECGG